MKTDREVAKLIGNLMKCLAVEAGASSDEDFAVLGVAILTSAVTLLVIGGMPEAEIDRVVERTKDITNNRYPRKTS